MYQFTDVQMKIILSSVDWYIVKCKQNTSEMLA